MQLRELSRDRRGSLKSRSPSLTFNGSRTGGAGIGVIGSSRATLSVSTGCSIVCDRAGDCCKLASTSTQTQRIGDRATRTTLVSRGRIKRNLAWTECKYQIIPALETRDRLPKRCIWERSRDDEPAAHHNAATRRLHARVKWRGSRLAGARCAIDFGQGARCIAFGARSFLLRPATPHAMLIILAGRWFADARWTNRS